MLSKYKILKAVQEGIHSSFKFSSNSTIDNSNVIDFSDSKINTPESFNVKNLERDFVDLGLPSGLKWAKFNIGAICQNTPESWYGNYYAWGETTTKHTYSLETCDSDLWDKYAKNHPILEPEDDVVTYAYYGIEKFRMPTKEDWQELLDNTIHIWEKDYMGITGLNGIVFSGNQKSFIFIPAAGNLYKNIQEDEHEYCVLWASSFSENHIDPGYKNNIDSYFIIIGENYNHIDTCAAYYGMPVRGVYK